MAFEHEGIEGVIAVLKRAARLPDECAHELRTIADETLQTAKHMTPVDYEDLQKSITMRARNARGHFAKIGSVATNASYEIFINENHPVADPKKLDAGVTKVGDYARQVHEYMGYGNTQGAMMANGRPFMPSDKSVAAGQAHGVEAGGRFIDRAALKTQQTILARLGSVILRVRKAVDF